MNYIKDYLQNCDSFIAELKNNNLYRKPFDCEIDSNLVVKKNKRKLISFCSNDYLGLSQNKKVINSTISAIKKFGIGSGASRYITGNNPLYSKLEKEIAKYRNTEDSIIFSSGYSCAIGVIPALVGDGDLIVSDRLIHSCLIDAAKLSSAQMIRFQHNKIEHCIEILKRKRHDFKNCLIITEGVFSMDGDRGKILELLKIANQFQCILISDNAHEIGLEDKISSQNYLQMGTLSKSFGALGGYVAGDKSIIEYLRNRSKTVIYSTALPPLILQASLTSLKFIQQKKLAKKLMKNVEYFCRLMKLEKPESAIVVIIIGDNKKVLDIAKEVEKRGFLIGAIRPPTVEKNKSRLRITFCSLHTKNQIKQLALALNEILKK